MMETSSERKVLRYECRVNGLFGRNRKVKFEIFALVKECDPAAPMVLDALMPIFRAKLAEIKFKGGVASIDVSPITLTVYSGGERTYTTESYALLSSTKLYSEKIEGGGVVFR